MLMLILTIIAAFVALMYFKTKVNNNKNLDTRLTEHVPSKKTSYIGDTAEETIRREKVMKFAKYFVSYAFLALLAFFMIVPFYWMIATSLKTEAEIELAIPTFYPHVLALSKYPLMSALPESARNILSVSSLFLQNG